MRKAIRTLFRTPGAKVKGPTMAALVRRGLATPEGVLTPEGRRAALSMVPLASQCRTLGVPLEDATFRGLFSRPERVGLFLAHRAGWSGTCSEGATALMILRAGLFPYLLDTQPYPGAVLSGGYLPGEITARVRAGGSTEVNVEARKTKMQDALHSRRNLNTWWYPLVAQVEAQRENTTSWPDRLTPSLGMAIAQAVGFGRWSELLSALLEDPYRLGKGWPDLTLVRGSEVKLVEIKTSDRLQPSQLYTIPILRDRVGLPVEVWRLHLDRKRPRHLDLQRRVDPRLRLTSGESVSLIDVFQEHPIRLIP